MANGSLPRVSQGGELTMTLHQVNRDGAGPYVCMIDATGTGTNWVAMDITQQVPGERGNNRDGETTDFVCAPPLFPLLHDVPADAPPSSSPSPSASPRTKCAWATSPA